MEASDSPLHVLHHTRVGNLEPNDLGVEVANLSVDLSDADYKRDG